MIAGLSVSLVYADSFSLVYPLALFMLILFLGCIRSHVSYSIALSRS